MRRRALPVIIVSSLVFMASEAAAYTYIDECGPTWEQLPVTYYIDEAGTEQYDDFAEVEASIQSSFNSWSQPCCTDFQSEYGGPVDPDEVDAPLISFHDHEWPASYGGPDTLAVTMVLLDEDCHIDEAPIYFNSAHHDFVDGDEVPLEGNAADLEAVAAHEVGHLLGLGHSEFLEATMYSAYLGGTEPRELHEDDIDGVCSLYPTECVCASDEDCRSGEVCDDGVCIPDRCTGDDDCQVHFLCTDGECLPDSCEVDDDCSDDLICENERCVTACPACRPCTEHTDCGHQGYCRVFPHGGRCMIACTSDGHCPGDSVCTEVQQGQESFPMCTAPDANHPNEYCPDDYICADFDDDFEPCPGLGKSCSNQSFECSPDNDVCLEIDDELQCSCTCTTDADCGAPHRCVDMGEQYVCMPPLSEECGDDADCDEDHFCIDGECTPVGSGNQAEPGERSCSSTSGQRGGFIILWIFLAMGLRRRSER